MPVIVWSLSMVRSRGLEPPRELPHSDLNAARLPIPPRPHCPGLGDARIAPRPERDKFKFTFLPWPGQLPFATQKTRTRPTSRQATVLSPQGRARVWVRTSIASASDNLRPGQTATRCAARRTQPTGEARPQLAIGPVWAPVWGRRCPACPPLSRTPPATAWRNSTGRRVAAPPCRRCCELGICRATTLPVPALMARAWPRGRSPPLSCSPGLGAVVGAPPACPVADPPHLTLLHDAPGHATGAARPADRSPRDPPRSRRSPDAVPRETGCGSAGARAAG
jgi:hypothetical protein